MHTIRALRVALAALPFLTLATFADAAPANPARAEGLAQSVIAKAGVTIGRHRALPKKKRIHHERKAQLGRANRRDRMRISEHSPAAGIASASGGRVLGFHSGGAYQIGDV